MYVYVYMFVHTFLPLSCLLQCSLASSGCVGWVLGAFFYGYLITQIPGGWLAERYGGKMVYGIGIVMTSVLTLFTPLAAETNVWLLVAVRVAEGFFEVLTKLHTIFYPKLQEAKFPVQLHVHLFPNIF